MPSPPRTKTLLGSAGSWLPGRITTGMPASASRRPVRSSTGAGTRLLSNVSPASRTTSARAARATASTAARPSVPSLCLVALCSSSTCRSELWTRRRSTGDGWEGGIGRIVVGGARRARQRLLRVISSDPAIRPLLAPGNRKMENVQPWSSLRNRSIFSSSAAARPAARWPRGSAKIPPRACCCARPAAT